MKQKEDNHLFTESKKKGSSYYYSFVNTLINYNAKIMKKKKKRKSNMEQKSQHNSLKIIYKENMVKLP